MNTRREPPGRKKRITPRSASSSFVTRGRKNVYWGKFKKGERPVTTDITGRPLRAKNFHSPGLGVIPANDVYRKRKKYGDRPYKGTFTSGFVTSGKRSERPWRGDVSGHAIRSRPPRVSQAPGQTDYSNYLSDSFSRKRTTRSIPVRRPQGKNIIGKFFNGFRGVKTPKGGGSVSKGFNNKGEPISVKAPGIGAQFVGGYQGFFRTRRPLKGGGSISGRGFNNGGMPINGKAPSIGVNMASYRGNIRGRVKTFSQEGLSFSGTIKARRPLKGGGSISGRGFNNGGRAIAVKAPGIGANMGDFSGNMKFKRPEKGGGSISGKIWNNGNSAINVKSPGIGAKFVGQYQGFFRATRTPKGGGSISGSWNNQGRPVSVKAPGIGAKFVGQYQGFVKQSDIAPGFGYQGETYRGSIKARRPPKGGGSISGVVWNNGGNPINRKSYSPAALKVSVYAGGIRAKRPEKGGGSISGKLWNNNEQPILTKAPAVASASEMGYSGRIKLPFLKKKYIRNPNADKEALKKIRPDKTTYAVAGLQIKVKQKNYEHNKVAAKGSLKGVAPGKNSLKAAEYSGHMKMLWAYQHNPNGNDHALKTIKPTNSFTKGNAYAGGLKMKKYIHNPNSNKNALDVLAPGRAVARIKDYQGNIKMNKPNGKNLFPDAQFAHGYRGNVKQERTFMMNVKLKWAKLFRKNATQPDAVKEKVRRPRYDKRERDLWKDLYD